MYISPCGLQAVYLDFKSTLQPNVPPPLYLHQSINDADLPLYAAVCTSDSSLSTCSSSSVDTVSDTDALENYYIAKNPATAHCRPRRIG